MRIAGVCLLAAGFVFWMVARFSIGGFVCGEGAGPGVGNPRALFEDSESRFTGSGRSCWPAQFWYLGGQSGC